MPRLTGAPRTRRSTNLFTPYEAVYPNLPQNPESNGDDTQNTDTQNSTQTHTAEQSQQLQRENTAQEKYDAVAATNNKKSVRFSITEETENESVEQDIETAEQLKAAVDADPEQMLAELNELMDLARGLKEERDLLFHANDMNKDKYETVKAQLDDATHTISQTLASGSGADGVGADARLRGQLNDALRRMRAEANKAKGLQKALEEAQANQMTEDTQDLKNEYNDVVMENFNMKDELDAHKDEIREHNDEIKELKAKILTLSGNKRPGAPARSERAGTAATDMTSRSTVSINPAAQKPVTSDKDVPIPHKFKGTEFYPWQGAMAMKLDSTEFQTVEAGLRYVLCLLEGPPWQMVNPRVPSAFGGRPCSNPYESVEDLMAHLEQQYGDLNTKSKARTQMATLTQSDDECFADFYAKFQQYSAYLNLEDDDLIYELTSKLNSKYGGKVNDGMVYEAPRQVVDRCRKLEDTFAINADRAKKNAKPRAAKVPPTTKETSEDKTASWPAKYKNLPKLTPADREKLRTKGACFRCREPGHIGSEFDKCPLSRQNLATSAMAAAATASYAEALNGPATS